MGKMALLVSFIGFLMITVDDHALSHGSSVLNIHYISKSDRILKGNLVAFVGSIFAAIFFMKLNSEAKKYMVFERIYVLALVGIPFCFVTALCFGS